MEVHRKTYVKLKNYNKLYYVNGGTQDKDEKNKLKNHHFASPIKNYSYNFLSTFENTYRSYLFPAVFHKKYWKLLLDHHIKAHQKISTKSVKILVKKLIRILVLVLVHKLNSISGFKISDD